MRVQVGRGRVVVGVVAVGAAVVVLAGCGGGSGGDRAGASSPSPTASVEASPTELISEIPTLAPTTPSTPEDRLNALADEKGWSEHVQGDLYATPADMVQDVCDSLGDQDSLGESSPAQWLGSYGYDGAERQLITAGVPMLCPEWSKTVKAAFTGAYPVYFGDGTYKVTSRRADDTVPPGTYRASGDLEGCYWERATADGTIIANKFATAATSMTVTIRASDDLFTTRSCGIWKPVH